jgi:hypothetical protein
LRRAGRTGEGLKAKGMAEFNIRTDSVDVEQIMRQIRARIKEKRGVDYTEQQIQELANVKLQRFLDPKGVRSDLVEQFKRTRGTNPEPPNYGFEDTTLYETHRGIVRLIRKVLNPILKLFFNPNPIVHVLHLQGEINNINAQQFRVREELDALYYEVIHNLVLEVTRLGIESKNLKMRLESLSSRMDFDERRARALEGVVQYKPGTGPARESQPQVQPSRAAEPHRQPAPYPQPAPVVQASQAPGVSPAVVEEHADGTAAGATGTARRRRRRRRGRRGGRGRGLGESPNAANASRASGDAAPGTPPHGDPVGSAAHGVGGSAPHESKGDFYDREADGDDSDADAGGGGSEPSEQ